MGVALYEMIVMTKKDRLVDEKNEYYATVQTAIDNGDVYSFKLNDVLGILTVNDGDIIVRFSTGSFKTIAEKLLI